jgi:hypothetical protein
LSPEAQEEIEKAEDEFVTQTEEAVGVMKNVSLHPKQSSIKHDRIDQTRFLTHLSPCATLPNLSPLRLSTTRRHTRFSPSSLPLSRASSLSKKCVVPLGFEHRHVERG